MTNHLSEQEIWRFLTDELTDDELDAVEAHMEACDDCCLRLAELSEVGECVPDLFPLEQPSAHFADRVMSEIHETREFAPVIPLPVRPKKSRFAQQFEVFNRFVTAAAVTGLMVFGATHVSTETVVGSVGAVVSETGNVVTDGTNELYKRIDQWVQIYK